MFFLKDPGGSHSVGATCCVVPLEKPIVAGDAKIPGQEEAGIRLEEVAFTMFYPTSMPLGNKKYRKGLRWLTGSLQTEIAGLGHFAGASRWMIWLILAPFLYAFGQFINVPVYQNAPLLYPTEDRAKWPLVIFSHGLGGSPTTYSQLCIRLASSGKIVIAMEHRDGTMPSCVAPYHGRKRPLLYIKESEVTWEEKPEGVLPLRIDQLTIRQHEIYVAYSAFTMLVLGANEDSDFGMIQFVDDSSRTIGFKETWSNAPINVRDVCLAGHSFGGCTMFSILSSKSPMVPDAKPYLSIPVRDTLILDPWLEPLPSPGPTPFSGIRVNDDSATVVNRDLNGNFNNLSDGNGHNNTRLLVINSEAFTLWTSHFERLAEVVKSWGPDAKLVTLLKSTHTSFSDYHVFPFTGSKTGARLIDIISMLSLAFLDNPDLVNGNWCSEEVLQSTEPKVQVEFVYTMPEKIVIGKWEDGHNKHRLVGELGQVVLH